MRYSDGLPKNSPNPESETSKKKEAARRRRYPPEKKTVTVSMPCVVVDMHGIILTWYLPGILTKIRQACLFSLSDGSDRSRKSDVSQNAMLTAREKLGSLLNIPRNSPSWRDNSEFFHQGDGPQGSANLSPGWFQKGYDVSASACSIHFSAAYSESENGAAMPTGFCKFPLASCNGVARCHLRIQCNM